MQIECGRLLSGIVLSVIVSMVVSARASAAEPIRASASHNPPPVEMLDAFDRVEIRPMALDADYSDSRSGRKAVDAVQRNFEKELQPWVAARNGRPARNTPPRVLVIEPRIDGVRFVGGAARFWLGPFMGSSRVLLRLRLVDAATGAVVAEPEFYQHTRGMSGGFTLGVMDKAMFVRVAGLAADYLEKNTTALVGGPTGAEGTGMATPSASGPGPAVPASTASVAGGNATQDVAMSTELTYDNDPAQAARSLAAIHNCNARFRQEGTNGTRSDFHATCWGGRTIEIGCESGTCRILH